MKDKRKVEDEGLNEEGKYRNDELDQMYNWDDCELREYGLVGERWKA